VELYLHPYTFHVFVVRHRRLLKYFIPFMAKYDLSIVQKKFKCVLEMLLYLIGDHNVSPCLKPTSGMRRLIRDI
jgi:hypothetical protein